MLAAILFSLSRSIYSLRNESSKHIKPQVKPKAERRMRIFENSCWREYLDLKGRNYWQAGKDCIMRSFIQLVRPIKYY